MSNRYAGELFKILFIGFGISMYLKKRITLISCDQQLIFYLPICFEDKDSFSQKKLMHEHTHMSQ